MACHGLHAWERLHALRAAWTTPLGTSRCSTDMMRWPKLMVNILSSVMLRIGVDQAGWFGPAGLGVALSERVQ